MKTDSKKTQQGLPGLRAASEDKHVVPRQKGSTTFYYICDVRASVMLCCTPTGMMMFDYDLQQGVPHLFTLQAARCELKRWPGKKIKKWPYSDPGEWSRIRARW